MKGDIVGKVGDYVRGKMIRKIQEDEHTNRTSGKVNISNTVCPKKKNGTGKREEQ